MNHFEFYGNIAPVTEMRNEVFTEMSSEKNK